MTKKQKLRRSSFATDFDTQEDDFILADLDVVKDEADPSPVSLNHFLDDEEIIDSLLVTTGFSANDELEEDREPDTLMREDTDLADDFSGFEQFVVEPIEPIEQAEKNQHRVAEEIPVSDFHSMSDFDEIPDEEDAIDRLLVDAGFEANHELKEDDGAPNARVIDDSIRANEFGVNLEGQNAMSIETDSIDLTLDLDKDSANDFAEEKNPESEKPEQTTGERIFPIESLESLNNDAGITTLSSFISEQEAIKNQLTDYENKLKKAAVITYASLSFGIVALVSAVVMGVMVSSMHTKVSRLTELVSILEEDMSGITEKDSDMDISNSDSSIEQLNQKTNALPEHSEEQSQLSSDRLESRMADIPAKHPAVKKISAEKPNTTQTATGWSVNLTAYGDLNYAKSKAAKFIQKGMPVKIIAVNMNNATWYRLKVGGFKNKEDATSYAAKIKKSLNLNTVFVGDN